MTIRQYWARMLYGDRILRMPIRAAPAVTAAAIVPVVENSAGPIYMSSYYKIYTGAVVIGVIGAVGGYLYVQQQKNDAAAAMQAVTTDLLEARNSGAIQKAQSLIANKQPSDSLYDADLAIASMATFREMAFDREDPPSSKEWIQVIDMAKKRFESTRDPYVQAPAINLMMYILNETRDPIVAAEIFKDEPFKTLNGKDRETSLKNLATYSTETYPTAPAYLMLARVRANAINRLLKPGSVMPIDNSYKPGLILRAEQIEEDIKSARLAAEATKIFEEKSAYGSLSILWDSWNIMWSAFALSQAARVDKKYWTEAEGGFMELIRRTETTVDENGKTFPAFQQFEIIARINYACALYDIFGDARATDITAQLDTLSAMIERRPDLYNAQHRLFDSISKNRQSFDPQLSDSARRQYQEFSGLAKYSPAFTSYLNSRGWEL